MSLKTAVRRVLASNTGLTLAFGTAWTGAVVGGFLAWVALTAPGGLDAARGAVAASWAGLLRSSGPSAARKPPEPEALEVPAYVLLEREGADPVLAAEAGVVDFAGLVDGFGGVVIVEHGGDLATVYAYLEDLAVSAGDRVERGDALGVAGRATELGPRVVRFEVAAGAGVAAPSSVLEGLLPEEALFGAAERKPGD